VAETDVILQALASIEDPHVHRVHLGPSDLEELTRRLSILEIEVRHIDGSSVGSKAALLAELADAWDFPAHFGHNWDALNDCLLDLTWIPAAGYVTVITGADALSERLPEVVVELSRTFSFVGAMWATPGSTTVLPDRAAPVHLVLVKA
jgi:hypothetical protein